MPWFTLFVAGLLEIVWAAAMKQSDGFTRLWPSIWTLLAMFASFALLAVAMKSLPLGTAYAVWTGIGAVGSIAVGILWFSESADPIRIGCLLLIVVGILGLKFVAR